MKNFKSFKEISDMGYYFSDLFDQEKKMRPKHRCSPLISPVVPKSETGVMEMEQGTRRKE